MIEICLIEIDKMGLTNEKMGLTNEKIMPLHKG